jgi:hypothetical protein
MTWHPSRSSLNSQASISGENINFSQQESESNILTVHETKEMTKKRFKEAELRDQHEDDLQKLNEQSSIRGRCVMGREPQITSPTRKGN